MGSLTGKTALVVGASRGIGLAIAEAIAREGAYTILAARSLERLREHAAKLEAEGHRAGVLALDIADPSMPDDFPQADILINVAGTSIRRPFERYTADEYGTILRTNLHGLVKITQTVGSGMLARGKGGKIVFIGSLMSLLGLPYMTVYAITKSALAGLTRSLAAEWGRYNIQVNCIAPGFILTDLNREMWQSGALRDWLKQSQANPRMGEPSDIAPLAVFLSGPGADYITGQVIAVDGGYSTTAVWPFEPA